METRYDSYYEKHIPYKASLSDLEHAEHMSDELILAYIRNKRPENLIFIVDTHAPQNITLVPMLGIAMCSGDRVPTRCKMVEEGESLYNPLIEYDCLREDHWYHPYKIKFTPVDFEGPNERFYFSDFCSCVRNGHFHIIEV